MFRDSLQITIANMISHTTTLSRAAILLAILTFALSGAARADDQKACRLTELASVDMKTDSAGRPIVMTSMEGKDVAMLVDTGGNYSMVSRMTVNMLGLKPQHLPQSMFYMGTTGEGITSMTSGHAIRIGKLTADRFPFLILPYGWDDPQIGGTIAPDILSNFDVEFDFGAKKLHLMSPDHCPGQVVYWTQQAYMALPIRIDESKQIHFTATVDGKEMDALLDTGASASLLRLDMARSVLGWTTNPAELTCTDDHSYCHYPFKTLSFGGVTVGNPEIYIVPDKLAALRETGELHEHQGRMQAPALIIGTAVLKRLHLYISYKEDMIYATGAAAH